MFKASKKLDDPPKLMTMQEIQEDLETFNKVEHIDNRELVIADLKLKDDINNLNLNEWWDGFEVNQLQMKEMESMREQLNESKQELKQMATDEVEERRSILLREIEDNLKTLKQLKTPK